MKASDYYEMRRIEGANGMNSAVNGYMSIGQFAELTGITRPNLIFYDHEGLLRPALIRSNGYRMYDYKQVNLAYKIVTFRRMGMSLSQIKELVEHEDEAMPSMLDEQIKHLDEQIGELEQQRYNLMLYRVFQQRYDDRPAESTFTVEHMAAEEILVEDVGADAPPTMSEFLMRCRRRGIRCDCHIGRLFQRDLREGLDWVLPERVFFRKLGGEHVKAAGDYLVYTNYTDGSTINELYDEFARYIDRHDIAVMSDIYEDYPLAGIFASDRSQHLIRIAVRLR